MTLTIAERIRAQQDGGIAKKKENAHLLSIDEQIARLEAESTSGSDSSDSDSDDGSKRSVHSKNRSVRQSSATSVKRDHNLLTEETDESGQVIKLVSSLASERIAPLPKAYLPSSQCGTKSLKPGEILKDTADVLREKKIKADKKRARISKEKEDGNVDYEGGKRSKTNISTSSNTTTSGLEATVREMLRDYKPTGSDRRPFWCRICRHQPDDQEGMLAHRQTELHIMASKAEEKMSYCKLCRKQFTSPAQLKEHLTAKGHKERLTRVRTEQQTRASIPGLSY